MRCESCHSASASVHLTNLVDGKIEERHLCEICANAEGVKKSDIRQFLRKFQLEHFEEVKNHFDQGGTVEQLVDKWRQLPEPITKIKGLEENSAEAVMIAEVISIRDHFANGGTVDDWADMQSSRAKAGLIKQYQAAKDHFDKGGTAQQLLEKWLDEDNISLVQIDDQSIREGIKASLTDLSLRIQNHFAEGGSVEELVDKEFGNLFY